MKIRIVKNKLTEVDKFDKITDTRPPPKTKTKKQALDTIQLVLFGLSFVPAYGNFADLTNAFISFKRGHKLDAIIFVLASAPLIGASMVPITRALRQGASRKRLWEVMKMVLSKTFLDPKWNLKNGKRVKLFFGDKKRRIRILRQAWKYSNDANFVREVYKTYLSIDFLFQALFLTLGGAAVMSGTLDDFLDEIKKDMAEAEQKAELTYQEEIDQLAAEMTDDEMFQALSMNINRPDPSEEDLYKALGMPKE